MAFPAPKNAWPLASEAIAAKMWADGNTASDIATELCGRGHYVTRNAVLGLIHRRGFERPQRVGNIARQSAGNLPTSSDGKSEQPTGAGPRGKAPATIRGMAKPAEVERGECGNAPRPSEAIEGDGLYFKLVDEAIFPHQENVRPLLIGSRPFPLADLNPGDHRCRYECSGEVNPADFSFCGQPTRDDTVSYCARHAALCFIPSKPQRSLSRGRR